MLLFAVGLLADGAPFDGVDIRIVLISPLAVSQL